MICEKPPVGAQALLSGAPDAVQTSGRCPFRPCSSPKSTLVWPLPTPGQSAK